jgi:hypothetical protein
MWILFTKNLVKSKPFFFGIQAIVAFFFWTETVRVPCKETEFTFLPVHRTPTPVSESCTTRAHADGPGTPGRPRGAERNQNPGRYGMAGRRWPRQARQYGGCMKLQAICAAVTVSLPSLITDIWSDLRPWPCLDSQLTVALLFFSAKNCPKNN